MGSGRGKSRRTPGLQSRLETQAAAPWWLGSSGPADAAQVRFDKQKWQDFIKDSRLGKVKSCKYYAGESTATHLPDYEKTVTGLFNDAVAVGALVLPNQYSAEDFQFEVSEATGGRPGVIFLKSKPGSEQGLGRDWISLRGDESLGSWRTVWFLNHVADCVALLVS